MDVRIEKINIEKAGPINELQLVLKKFNLIYGLNEQGKTFLVEFVLRSLFRNLSGWSLRDVEGRGKVEVSIDGSPTILKPSSRNKLEDILGKNESGMPAQVSRLLVVKGAELSFDKRQRPGIGKEILKDFFSGQRVLDEIQGKIKATVQSSKFTNGDIKGPNRGKISSRNELSDSLADFDSLVRQVEAIYSGGEREGLQAKISELKEAIGEQESAKRHYAYQVNQRFQKHQEQLNLLPQDDVDNLRADLDKLHEAENRIGRQDTQLTELAQDSEGYEWLEEAISVYEQRGTRESERVSPLFPIAIVLTLLLAVISSFLGFPLGTVLLVILASVIGWLYLLQYQSAAEHAVDTDEIQNLRTEYQKRFDQPLSGLPQLKESKKSMDEAYHGSKTLAKELEDEKTKLENLQDLIVTRFRNLADKTLDRSDWESGFRKLRRQRNELLEQSNSERVELAALRIPDPEYQQEPGSVEYNEQIFETLQLELEQIEELLNSETDQLNNLKQRISGLTGDDISVTWEDLIQNLQDMRARTAKKFSKLTAEIAAGILVNKQLDVIRAEEEQQIQNKIESETVALPIYNITKRYSGLQYDEGTVYVSDDYGRFALSDLSTGALEQVLLGLRLGFASKLLDATQLFLILDDAFQHADWGRRQRLVDQMVTLANNGWQIIYFTMDDHIKELFDEAGNQYFQDQYLSRNLDPVIQTV
jgi:uncharacterized protein YhaN